MLIDGHVEVHVSPGDGTSLRKALLHAPTGTYSDGQAHSISLVRSRRYLPRGTAPVLGVCADLTPAL